ncbi:MAG TPA: hypothetical protein VN642_15275, partial [Dongiaceae bacterium]|nr:hypothetical protein [Dongiaceae bacterium]
APATLRIVITNVQPGFGVGEFMHVNFQGFPAGLNKGTSFPMVLNSIFGGPANSANTAALPGITLSATSLTGL